MTVTNPIDGVTELFTLTEADRKVRDSREEESDVSTGTAAEAEKLETQFSRLLKGQLTENMVFTRIDQQLSLPQQVITDRSTAPVLDRRSDVQQNDDIDTYDPSDRPTDHDRHLPAAAAAVDRPYEAAPRPEMQSQNVSRPAASSDTGQSAASSAQTDGQAPANRAGNTAGNAAGTSAAQAAANRTMASADLAGDIDVPELMELSQSAVKSGAGKIVGKVTIEQTPIASQPQAVLTAKAAVDASIGRGSSTQNTGTANTEGVSLEEGESSFTSAIFASSRPSSTSSNASTSASAGAQLLQAGDPQKLGQNQAQAAAIPQQQTAMTQLGGLGNTQTSTLTGTAQSGITVDASGSGTAAIGENNSLQQRSSAPATQQAPRSPHLPQQALADQLAVNIQKGLNNGQDKITINLRPQELGRVEIKMEVAHDGKLTAVVAAEKPETLDLLRQDARSLIQSLADAGLQADQSSLSFNLQGQFADAGGNNSSQGSEGAPGTGTANDDDPFETGFLFQESGGFGADGRLDVRI